MSPEIRPEEDDRAYLLLVCSDCRYAAAYAEAPTDPQDGQPEPLALLIPGETLVTSTEEPHFSTMPCDTCGTTLAGDRFRGTLITDQETP